ncbi:EamA family transporter [Paludisphaera rhizosphaerae]|uniref:EamA family transporter n=1 Tax=Paludisphaera rhizosphaerae TaxID=2711216 RepID=UPI0013EB7506|nr:EamA family transporter [Paludisphaera rhizosphaerae]
MRFERRTWLLIAAFAIVYMVWGSTYLAIRIGLKTLPPLLMAGSRFLVAGSILCGLSLARGSAFPSAGQWRRAAVGGVLMLAVGNGCVTWAEQFVPSSITALLIASEPLWLVLTSWAFFGGQRPGARITAGLAIGLAGVGALVLPGGGEGDAGGMMLIGSLAIILAAFSWAVGSLYLREAALPDSTALSTGMQMLAGGATLVTLGLLRGEAQTFHAANVSAASAAAWVYLIVFGSLLGYTAYGWLITATSPARLGTYAYVNPVVAVLLGSLVEHEPITAAAWTAMIVILASVGLVTTGEMEEDEQPEEAESLVFPTPLGEQA